MSREQLSRHLGKRLIGIRKKRGISQTKLSQKTGIAISFIERLEAGASCPSAWVLWRLSEGLMTEPHNFFYGYRENKDG